jgi:glycosyltransferase
MKISLITSTYNSAATIADTLQSVRDQEYTELEYIVIDGGSTDKTLEILKANSDLISILVSEPDKGIYDALNKGVELASGEVVGFIHSDDLLAKKDVLQQINNAFEDASIEAVYADLDYVAYDNLDHIVRKWRSRPFQKNLFYKGWMPAHPTFYLRKRCYDQFGSYNIKLRQSADYELMLRMLLKHKVKSAYVPQVWVKMRIGGASNASWKNRWRANQEDYQAWKMNDLNPRWYTRWLKPLSKLAQFT